MGDFTPRDEISDWSIATAHALVAARLDERRALFPIVHAIKEPQAMWEVIVTVARSVASVLRPAGALEPGPIGHQAPAVLTAVGRMIPAVPGRPAAQPMVERVTLTAGQLIGCASDGDYAMCRALAASVLSARDSPLTLGGLVLRAMLEILAAEPVLPRPQEPTS